MKTTNLLLAFCTYLFLFQPCTAQEAGKHLFILSGQSNMVGLNPKESFIPTIEAEFGKGNTIVIKDAMGTQPISRWFKDWKSPNDSVPKEIGDLYDRLIKKVFDSISNQKIATVSFIWMQGERDARLKFGAVYEKSLLGLYSQLCTDLKRTDVNFIVGRLSDFGIKNENYSDWNLIRAIQMKVGESNNRFGWINTDDLNNGMNRQGKLIDNDIHMSLEGYKIMGKRFADKAIQSIKDNK